MYRAKPPRVPAQKMSPELAVRMLRTLTGGQFKKATLWEFAAIIEQLAENDRVNQPGLTPTLCAPIEVV